MIELIFVIIILGVLAATALPRFIGIQDDAKISAEKGVAGAVRGGVQLAHGKWILKQQTSLDWDGDDVAETFSSTGYLANLETGGAYSNTATPSNIFAELLSEPAEEWARTANGDGSKTNTYEGPASSSPGVANSGMNDINTSGQWTYGDSEEHLATEKNNY